MMCYVILILFAVTQKGEISGNVNNQHHLKCVFVQFSSLILNWLIDMLSVVIIVDDFLFWLQLRAIAWFWSN